MSESSSAPDASSLAGETFAHRPSTRGSLRKIFLGADGMRAGWSFVLFYTIITILQFLVKSGFKLLHQVDPDQLRRIARDPGDLVITCGVPFVVVAVATFLMSRIERRSLSTYGIGATPGAIRQFVKGVFWGAALLSLLVLALWRFHLLAFDGLLLSGSNLVRFSIEWAIGFLCVALFEEASSRGFILFTLSRGVAGSLRFTRAAPHAKQIGFWVTAVLLSCLFGYAHSYNTSESALGLFAAGLLGFAYCVSLWRTGSLWWAIGMHASWDWAQSFLYGVADSGHVVRFTLLSSHVQGPTVQSGGPVGPEGSIYAIPTILLSFAVVLLTLRRTGWPAKGGSLASVPGDDIEPLSAPKRQISPSHDAPHRS